VTASLSDDSMEFPEMGLPEMEQPQEAEPPARPWSRAVTGAQELTRRMKDRVKDRWSALTETMPFAP
jgi:hypothetical protein